MSSNNPAPRTPLVLDISYRRSYGRREELGTLKNLSLSGAFIEVEQDVEITTSDKIVIELSVSNRIRKIPALVVWKNQHGCGIRFQHSNNRDQQIVDDLIYFAENTKHGQRSVLDSIFKKVG